MCSNLKNWHLRHLAYLIQNFLFFICLLILLIRIRFSFHEIDIILLKFKRTIFFQDDRYNIQYLFLYFLNSNVEYRQSLLLIRESFENSFYPVILYGYFYFIRVLIFKNKYTISHVSMGFLVILLDNNIFGIVWFLTLFAFCYLEKIIEKSKKDFQRRKWKEYKDTLIIDIMCNLICLIGTILFINVCIQLTRLSQNKVDIMYFNNANFNTNTIFRIYEKFKISLILILGGNLINFGSFIFNLCFYSIEKEFFKYSNTEYEKYIISVRKNKYLF
jgi:hypothetical protein